MFDLTHRKEAPGSLFGDGYDHVQILFLVSAQRLINYLQTIDTAIHCQYYVTEWGAGDNGISDIINNQPLADEWLKQQEQAS